MGKDVRDRAIVLGASMAGLLATRVLSEHYATVTLLERDVLPEGVAHRKCVPQGHHLHVLLARGEQIMTRLFPDLVDACLAGGAVRVDLPGDVRWFQCGGYKVDFRSGIAPLSSSRPFLESLVRSRVRARPNVDILEGVAAEGLVTNADRSRVVGVQMRRGDGSAETLNADLVVDATGRGSRSPRWLQELGYEPPAESIVRVGIGYVTREYRAVAGALPGGKSAAFTMPHAPRLRRGGALVPIEGGRWIATVCGWLGDHAPLDDAGFLDYVRGLAAPDIHDALQGAEPLTEPRAHKFPTAQRRHYERLRRFPAGYLVMGDAIASFNPVYGQGMTVSACEAEALDACLGDASIADGSPALARRLFRRAAAAVDAAWMLSTGEDFRFPEVEGPRPPGTGVLNWYAERMQRATLRDEEVTRAFYRVMSLTQSPGSIFAPALAWRILGKRGRAIASGEVTVPFT